MAGIAGASEASFTSLKRLCNSDGLKTYAPALSASLNNILSRFHIWSVNIGATQETRLATSLGHRVRAAPNLAALFLARLNDLQEDLNDLEATLADANEGTLKHVQYTTSLSDPAVDSSNHDSDTLLDVTALLKALNEDITSLFKLSIAARKAGTRDRYVVALARIDPSRVLDEEREAEMIGDQCPRLSSPGLKWLRARLQSLGKKLSHAKTCNLLALLTK